MQLAVHSRVVGHKWEMSCLNISLGWLLSDLTFAVIQTRVIVPANVAVGSQWKLRRRTPFYWNHSIQYVNPYEIYIEWQCSIFIKIPSVHLEFVNNQWECLHNLVTVGVWWIEHIMIVAGIYFPWDTFSLSVILREVKTCAHSQCKIDPLYAKYRCVDSSISWWCSNCLTWWRLVSVSFYKGMR